MSTKYHECVPDNATFGTYDVKENIFKYYDEENNYIGYSNEKGFVYAKDKSVNRKKDKE